MRRFLALLLTLPLLGLPVQAAYGNRYVALTFDDGPSGRYTRTLLDGLSRRGVKATFFLCGYRMKEYPSLTQRIHTEGHEIGLHGYSHSSMKEMERQVLERELNDSLALLPSGCRPVYMRPPGGEDSPTVHRVARRMGLSVLSWSVDPRDWASDDAAAITAAVTGVPAQPERNRSSATKAHPCRINPR